MHKYLTDIIAQEEIFRLRRHTKCFKNTKPTSASLMKLPVQVANAHPMFWLQFKQCLLMEELLGGGSTEALDLVAVQEKVIVLLCR